MGNFAMSTPVEMTPERAMDAVMTLRDALKDIESKDLPERALLSLVIHLVYPQELDSDDIAWAQKEAQRIVDSSSPL